MGGEGEDEARGEVTGKADQDQSRRSETLIEFRNLEEETLVSALSRFGKEVLLSLCQNPQDSVFNDSRSPDGRERGKGRCIPAWSEHGD